MLAGRFQLAPYPQVRDGIVQLVALSRGDALAWYYRRTSQTERVDIHRRGDTYDGVNLVTSIADGDRLSVEIVAMDGTVVHAWDVDWFDIWPDPQHLSEAEVPKSPPGTNIHGAEIMANGDLVFNYLDKGLVRLDICGNVVWRLPYRTHHSIDVDADGNLWVPGKIPHTERDPRFPNYEPPFLEFTLLKVSPDGEILEEISVPELLQANGLGGLLYLSTTDNLTPTVTGDTLHMNDAETFPAEMAPGAFAPGDIMISLRNINAILVFRENDRTVKYMAIGRFVRQHDPDFIDGDTISVFDNNNLSPGADTPQSRIVILSADDDRPEVYFQGSERQPFFTDIMGKHQWLPNGNLLVTESRAGRAFELDPAGEVVWQYYNLVAPGQLGWMEEVQRLPGRYQRTIERALNGQCRARCDPCRVTGSPAPARRTGAGSGVTG